MNKKVIKSMFQNICSKDEMRPIMGGVHFEKERCYASDGHILVIFKEGSAKLEGKTISLDGQEIEGRYPNVDSVMPSKENQGESFVVDFVQLKNACNYHIRQMSASEHDKVVINNVGLNIRTLHRLLCTLTVVGDPHNIKFFSIDKSHAVTVESDQMKGLIMPTLFEDGDIDYETEFGESKTFSYENFINDYVFNSWRKQPKVEMAWAD
jgi:hypothetical protein